VYLKERVEAVHSNNQLARRNEELDDFRLPRSTARLADSLGRIIGKGLRKRQIPFAVASNVDSFPMHLNIDSSHRTYVKDSTKRRELPPQARGRDAVTLICCRGKKWRSKTGSCC
jgi:hypothetical protein